MKLIVGITGASGSLYGIRLLEELVVRGTEIHLILTSNGEDVLRHETGLSRRSLMDRLETLAERRGGQSPGTATGGMIFLHENGDLFSPPASGSFLHDGMIIVPCSMASLAGIASGSLHSLLGRAADVTLKERRRLIVVPRETPMSRIHLKAMLTLDEAGGMILPASPAFYNRPGTVDDLVDSVVSRILNALGIENSLFTPWGDTHE